MVICHNFLELVLPSVAKSKNSAKAKLARFVLGGAVMRLILICGPRTPPHVQLGVFSKLGKINLDNVPSIEYNFTHGDKNYI